MKDNRLKEAIKFGKKNNLNKISHSGSDFLTHLKGTYHMLKEWGEREELCLAGFFHNIYGNRYFNPPELVDINTRLMRRDIVDIVGDEAEMIAYTFNKIKREKILESRDKDLLILQLANEFDNAYKSNNLSFLKTLIKKLRKAKTLNEDKKVLGMIYDKLKELPADLR